ncbi:hypothetical protein SDC9_80966 [bioreactor metagenome]|uniref:Uncharacterized protein n=1 Tax=bioreactor metagenome TaxID=1076179 RepID=A0A644Z6N7_9ZZZZ
MDKSEKRFLSLVGLAAIAGVLAIAFFSPRTPPQATGELRLTITGERTISVEYCFACPDGLKSKGLEATVTEFSVAVMDGSAKAVCTLYEGKAELVWQTPQGLVTTQPTLELKGESESPEGGVVALLPLDAPKTVGKARLTSGVLRFEARAEGVTTVNGDLLTEAPYRTIEAVAAEAVVLTPDGEIAAASSETRVGS